MNRFVLLPRPAAVRLETMVAPRLWRPRLAEAGVHTGLSRWVDRVSSATASPESAVVEIRLEDVPGMRAEAYQIAIASAELAVVRASGEAGFRNGLSTILQMSLQGMWALGDVADEPLHPVRGYMLDISRDKVPQQQTLLDLIDLFAILKLNQLQLYTEHTYQFSGHERVWKDASALSAEEIRALDERCREVGIELVPNLNCLGHMERWLRHPEYRHLAECPDGITLRDGRVLPSGTTLLPGPEANTFLAELLDQYLPLFSSPVFNCGLDEPWELGLGRSGAGETGRHGIYMEHLQAVAGMAAEHGKRLQFWADIILQEPASVASLPEGITGMVWGYEADHPFDTECPHFAASGVPFILCPGTLGWNSIGGRWATARTNIASAATAARKHGAMGLLLTDWGDNGHHQPLPVTLPPLLLAAALAWGGEAPTDGEIAEAIDVLVLRDASRMAGGLLLALGSVAAPIARRLHNTHVLHRLLFAQPQEMPQVLQGVGLDEIMASLAAADSIITALPGSQPQGWGGILARDEIELAARLLRCAASRGLLVLTGQDLDPVQGEIRELIPCYEKIWLRRNRPGGLPDSLRRFHDAWVQQTPSAQLKDHASAESE